MYFMQCTGLQNRSLTNVLSEALHYHIHVLGWIGILYTLDKRRTSNDRRKEDTMHVFFWAIVLSAIFGYKTRQWYPEYRNRMRWCIWCMYRYIESNVLSCLWSIGWWWRSRDKRSDTLRRMCACGTTVLHLAKVNSTCILPNTWPSLTIPTYYIRRSKIPWTHTLHKVYYQIGKNN